jgi:uncharacterized RDD family membrane protein YckC
MDERQGPGGGLAGPGDQPPPGALPPPPPPAQPTHSGWAVHQPAPASQTYWGDPEPPRDPPPAGTEYASVGRRFVAWLIDLVPLIALTVVLFIPIMVEFFDFIDDLRPGSGTSRAELQATISTLFATSMPGFLRMSALLQLAALLYHAGTWLLFGRSPGMAVMGIRIVREEDAGRPGFARVAVRYAGYLLSAAFVLIGYAWAIFDSRKQTWHDKLAGTLVVRDARTAVAAAGPATAANGRRPSIGAMTETAWTWYARSLDDVLSSLAFILIPTTIVTLPFLAAIYATGQDQTRETVNGMLSLFNSASSLAAMDAYNLRVLASSAPIYAIGGLFTLVSGLLGTIILGACAAAWTNASSSGPARHVGSTVAARLPALTAIGLVAGVAGAGTFLVIGLPAITVAMNDGTSLNVTFVAIAALTLLIATPIGLYLSGIWILAVVAIVREDIGVAQAVRRARTLARGRMRWVLGVLVVSGLVYSVIVLPIGTLPAGLLSEAYLDGSRIPVVIEVTLTGALTLFALPAMFLVYVETYRAAVDDAARASFAGDDPAVGDDPAAG